MKPLEQWQWDLLKAADILENGEWCRGWLELNGARCALGAIVAATGSAIRTIVAARRVTGHLKLSPGISLQIWNDKFAETKQEVVAALRGAALGGGE